MTKDELAAHYLAYLDCLNRQDWEALGDFVAGDATHNGRPLGLGGYRAMLERDYRAIPDLRFKVGLLVCDPPYVAARLDFECTPVGAFLGLPVNGRRVRFTEHVFYSFRDARISDVKSLLDRSAIEAQLSLQH